MFWLLLTAMFLAAAAYITIPLSLGIQYVSMSSLVNPTYMNVLYG
jgi:hypothetical protein